MARAARYGLRLDVALLAAAILFALVARGLPADLRDPIAATIRRTVVAPLISMQETAELTRNAFLTHKARMVERDSAALLAMSALSLEAENDRLREILVLGSRVRWGFVAAEALHGRGLAEEFTLTLTAGSRAGVRPFSPVVAPEGLVGMVRSVDPRMSLAIVWAHPDFRVSAMAADGAAFGIIAAHSGTGPGRYLMELRGVPFRSEIPPGSLIVSSGLGGVYPRGIPIGTVISELDTSEGWVRTYLVRPVVLPPNISSVMVLLPDRVDAGVQDVWASSVRADSAVRGIAAAGDSIARIRARREAERLVGLPVDSPAVEQQRPRPAARADTTPRRAAPPAAQPAAPVAGDTARTDTTPPLAIPRPQPMAPPVLQPVPRDTAQVRRDTTPPRPDTTPARPDTPRVVPRTETLQPAPGSPPPGAPDPEAREEQSP